MGCGVAFRFMSFCMGRTSSAMIVLNITIVNKSSYFGASSLFYSLRVTAFAFDTNDYVFTNVSSFTWAFRRFDKSY